jgi:hypothetical protein
MTSNLRVLLWLVAAATSASGLAMMPRAIVDRVPAIDPPSAESTGETWIASESVAMEAIWRAAPFRESRTPARERYDADRILLVDEPTPERPPWRLTGVLTGPAPLAVFEELPGQHEATHLLTAGDNVDAYSISAIAADSVVVEARGIRWTFTVDVPWR